MLPNWKLNCVEAKKKKKNEKRTSIRCVKEAKRSNHETDITKSDYEFRFFEGGVERAQSASKSSS